MAYISTFHPTAARIRQLKTLLCAIILAIPSGHWWNKRYCAAKRTILFCPGVTLAKKSTMSSLMYLQTRKCLSGRPTWRFRWQWKWRHSSASCLFTWWSWSSGYPSPLQLGPWSSNSAAASSSSIAAEAASDPNDHGIREVARIFSSDSILGYMKSSNDEEDEAMLSWRVWRGWVLMLCCTCSPLHKKGCIGLSPAVVYLEMYRPGHDIRWT